MATKNYVDVETIASLQIKIKPCYSFLQIASLHMKIWTTEEEAERLSKRFKEVNRASFARDYGVPGGQSMIYQHITGRRPIGIDAAQAYALGFKCKMEEISPRLAIEARKALSFGTAEPHQSGLDEISRNPETTLTPEQQQMLSLMESLGTEARAALLKAVALLSRSSANKPQRDSGVISQERSIESGDQKIQTVHEYSGPERRSHNDGHIPERRLGGGKYSDAHDLSGYKLKSPDETEQPQKRRKEND